jgi:hypothetical protein
MRAKTADLGFEPGLGAEERYSDGWARGERLSLATRASLSDPTIIAAPFPTSAGMKTSPFKYFA